MRSSCNALPPTAAAPACPRLRSPSASASTWRAASTLCVSVKRHVPEHLPCELRACVLELQSAIAQAAAAAVLCSPLDPTLQCGWWR